MKWLQMFNWWLKRKVFEWLDLQTDLDDLKREILEEVDDKLFEGDYATRDDVHDNINSLRSDLETEIENLRSEIPE